MDVTISLETLKKEFSERFDELSTIMQINLESLHVKIDECGLRQTKILTRVDELGEQLQETTINLERQTLTAKSIIDKLSQQARDYETKYLRLLDKIDASIRPVEPDIAQSLQNVEENFNDQMESYQKTVKRLHDEIQIVKSELDHQIHLSTHSEGEELAANSFKWEIPNFHRRIISSTFPHEITSAASWFPALGCQMKFTIYFQNASMFFFAAQYEKPYPDESNPFNYCHKITFKVLDFANDMNLIRVIEPRFKDKYATERTSKKALDSVEVDILHSTSGYLQNGKIVIHVIVESLNTLIKDLPYRHGTMVWRIENFYDNIRSCHNGISIKSNYFYSSKYGYRMQISLYTTVNRSLQQTYITFALRFLKGEFDKNLTTIYPHRTSITIVNKKFGGSRNILKQEESKMVDDDCFPSVVSIFDLESQGFLENDMLVVSVNVISLDGRVF